VSGARWSRALGTKVAQRVVILFAVCALVPVVVLGVSTYRSVQEALLQQARERARLESKRVGMGVSAELDALDAALAAADSSGGARVDPRLAAVALVVGGRPRSLHGPLPPLPDLSTAQRAQIEHGGSVLVATSRDGQPVVFLARTEARDRRARGVLWAEAPAGFLARIIDPEDVFPSGAGVCVLGPGGLALYCPAAAEALAAGALAPAQGRAPSGAFVLSAGGERLLAGFWSLFLEYRFAAPDWRIVYTEPVDAALAPLTRFRRTFPLAGLLALLVVALLSLVQIRRSFGPLRALREATQRVSRREFGQPVEIRSGDEFEDLASAFNGMALNLQRQFADAERLTEALRRTSAELQERGARLSAVLESAADAIVVLDPGGRIESFSGQAERLFGYTPQEAAGRPIADLFDTPLDGGRGLTVAEQLGRLTPQAVGQRRDGSTFPAEVAVSQARAGDRVLDTVFVRDISERKRAQEQREQLEAQLRQAQKMETVGTLAGGIAHDFNNLLAPILGTVELLLADAPPGDPLQDDLEQVRRAALQAKNLVRQILSFSRRAEQQLAPLPLTPLVGDLLTLLRASLPVTIDIRSELEAGVGVLGDSSQLQQVVMNLCTNAFHAMRESGGVLEVRLETAAPDPALAAAHPTLAAGRVARLTVRDTGHGMDPATLERLFEPFFTTKPPGEGTGLGMAIVHGIVTAHGGAITVDSAPGVGTTFEIYLPVRSTEAARAPEARAPAPRGEGRVLVVDDEAMIASITSRALARVGFEVATATSPQDALGMVERDGRPFDLVVTDQTMPGMTGLELATRIHAIHADLPVILMTGYAELGQHQEAKRQGIAELLIKPVEIEVLAAAVTRALHGSRQGAA
jgi:PAS domain S-box-containing protein